MASELIRSFLALPLVSLFKTEVHPFLERLREVCPEVRWVEVSQLHVTLHFFGLITPEDRIKISRIIRPIASQTKPFEILLKGVGAFPNVSRPRVIWIGVEGETENFKNLHQWIEKELENSGFPIEFREFKPHVTVGRVGKGKKFDRIHGVSFGPTTAKKVEEIVLFQSHLTPEGARYEPIEIYSLSSS